jgi:hypothetical protein
MVYTGTYVGFRKFEKEMFVKLDINVGDFLTAFAAIAAGLVALAQYLKSERWKRAEFAIAQMRTLSTDDTFSFCCRAIDWGVGPLPIPQKYRFLFPHGTMTVPHDWRLMAEALRPALTLTFEDPALGPQYLLYRYAFDDFFSYIDTLALYRHGNVVRSEDFAPIEPYLKQIRYPQYAEGGPTGTLAQEVFGDFVHAFYGERVEPWIQSV